MTTDVDILLTEDEEIDVNQAPAPRDLPEAREVSQDQEGKFISDAGRVCPRCGAEARIVSNLLGRQAYCGPCKFDWPLGPPVTVIGIPIQGRSVHGKQTVIPTDWDLAFEDIDPHGPK